MSIVTGLSIKKRIGRPPGALHSMCREMIERIESHGCDPVKLVCELAMTGVDEKVRLKACELLLKYVAPALQPVAVPVEHDEEELTLAIVNPEEHIRAWLEAQAKSTAKQIEGEAEPDGATE